MRRLLTVLPAAAVLAVVSGCGSESRVTVRPPPPLSRAVADSLANRSDAVAAALRRGDACAAKTQVHGLERQTRLAITAGRVPAAYRARLTGAVADLVDRMPRCVPLPPPPPPPPPKHEKPPKGKEHHDKHGKGRKD